jgi:hypothetical protein
MEETTVLAFGPAGGGSSGSPFLFVVPDHPAMTAYCGWHIDAMSDIYTHGHHESVLRSHAWRTAGNSAAAWRRRWADAPDAVFVVPHVEILARPGAVGDDAMAP